MATPTNLPAAQTTGNVLTAAYMNDLRGAFRVLQVLQATTVTQTASGSATYVSTTSTLTITPQSTSSKILVVSNLVCLASSSPCQYAVRIQRGATTVFTNGGAGYFLTDNGTCITSIYLDSPSTTSSTTYTIQYARASGVGTAYVQLGGAPSTLTLLEISA